MSVSPTPTEPQAPWEKCLCSPHLVLHSQEPINATRFLGPVDETQDSIFPLATHFSLHPPAPTRAFPVAAALEIVGAHKMVAMQECEVCMSGQAALFSNLHSPVGQNSYPLSSCSMVPAPITAGLGYHSQRMLT